VHFVGNKKPDIIIGLGLARQAGNLFVALILRQAFAIRAQFLLNVPPA
jgi:hypothetical protein